MSTASQVDSQPHEALVQAVAARTMRWNFRMWAFGESVALRGLLAASRATGDAEPLGFVRALLRSYVARGVGRSPEEHVAPGTELLLLHTIDPDDEWLDAARALAHLSSSAPMGPHGVRYRRPDLPGWRRQIWVDSMDSAPPFLARLARVTRDESYATEAVRELIGYTQLLQDERTGLLVHGFEETCGTNGQYWARGNGWAVMGLIETLALLSIRTPFVDELRQRLDALLAGLAARQHPSGLWPTVLDHPETPLDSSLAAMTVCAIDRGRSAGVLDDRYSPMRDRARAAVLDRVSPEGELTLVSDATPIGELRMYLTRPFGVFPWGQGPLLMMLCERVGGTEDPPRQPSLRSHED
jgi:unsaturated rhamnogalacturonyl hydrolase